jgi:hypothetical protein
MDQNRQKELVNFESMLKKKRELHRYEERMLELAKSDFEAGLTSEQIERYLQTSYDFGQMEILSECTGLNYPNELLDYLFDSGISGVLMEKAVHLYDGGEGIEQIKETLSGDNDSIEAAIANVAAKMDIAKRAAQGEPAYVAKLIEGMETMAANSNIQCERIKELEAKLEEFGQTAEEDFLISELLEQLQKRDGEIRALREAAEGADETQGEAKSGETEKDREIAKHRQTITELEAIADSQQKDIDSLKAMLRRERETARLMACPREGSARSGIRPFKNLFAAGKGTSIVKLVTSGNHSAEQIVQLGIAMERGLTKKQITALINSNAPAEKIKAVVEVAVLENRIKGVTYES